MTPEMLAEIQKIYDEWPEEEPLLPFDGFLAGGAMAPRNPQDTGMFNRQISGVRTPQDLLNPQELEPEIQTRNDLSQFTQTVVDLLSLEQYEQLFFAAKKAAYKIFNFLVLKSCSKGDTPFSEKDLVLEEEDYYVLEYLRGSTKDYYRVQQIATLMAYREMGVELVRFQNRDGCPLCASFDGLFYNVSYLLDLLGSGSDLTHPNCDAGWSPVIHRETYAGPLLGHLNVPEHECPDRVVVKNAPVEMLPDILKYANGTSFKVIEFVNMAEYLINEVDDLEDSSGIVVYCASDSKMLVHNSYVGLSGPVQFLDAYRVAQVTPLKSEVGQRDGEETFFVKGRAAVNRDGSFWDVETGDRLC